MNFGQVEILLFWSSAGLLGVDVCVDWLAEFNWQIFFGCTVLGA